MIAAVRAGASMRAVARAHEVSLSTVQWWSRRAGELPLDRVDWRDRSPIPGKTHRTEAAVEDLVLVLRRELKETSDLGEYGARAIRGELVARGHARAPSVRTIGRVLERRGALDAGRRIRRTPPPPGWYLPEVAAGRAELDSFDIVEGLALAGGLRLEVLNVISLHGGLPGSWPQPLVTAKTAVEALVEHWREYGRPTYAQFDNDTIFQGGHRGQDVLGRVVRTCLRLDVIPIFAPPQESGFQAAIENFNGRWQAKVWARFYHDSLAALQDRSRRYVGAYRQRAAARIEGAPHRRPFPISWHPDLQARPEGVVIFIRRTSELGTVSLLGRTFPADPLWPHRLVRCEVDLSTETIRFHALRRREPHHQPLLCEAPYVFPRKVFHE
jgi:transposase-like protein